MQVANAGFCYLVVSYKGPWLVRVNWKTKSMSVVQSREWIQPFNLAEVWNFHIQFRTCKADRPQLVNNPECGIGFIVCFKATSA